MPMRTRRKSGPSAASIERRPLWPAVPPPMLHLDLHRREVELVVEGGQRVDVELVEAQRLLNRVAAVVHVGLRLEQQDLVAADAAFADQAAEFLLPRAEAMHRGDGVGRHEADIVAVERILRARIAEAGPDLHRAASLPAENAHPASGMGVLVSLGMKGRSLGFLAAFGFAFGFAFAFGFFLADGRDFALRRSLFLVLPSSPTERRWWRR